MNKHKRLIFIGILFGNATNMLMQTVVASILPEIADKLNGWELYGWVFSSFLLISTITIPLFAQMADLYGYKRFYVIGMVVFLLGTLMCGLSPSMPFLIAARTLQGIGVGALGPVTIALISRLFSLENRGSAMGIYAAIQLLSNVIGPVLGGAVAQSLGWQWAFYMVIPLGLLSLLFIFPLRIEKEQKPHGTNHRLDIIGAIVLGISIALFIQGVTQFGIEGMNMVSLILFAASLLLFVLFIFQEKRHPFPVIPAHLILIKNVRLANMSAFIIGIIMYGAIAILPLYGEVVLGTKLSNRGTILIPLMIGMGIGIILSGRAVKKISYKRLAQIGWIISFVCSGFLVAVSFQDIWNNGVYSLIMGMGFGLGILLPTFLLPAQNAVNENEQAIVGGLIQLSRNCGGAIGIPILTGLLSVSNIGVFGNSYSFVFLFLTISTLIGFLIGRQYKGSVKEELENL